MPTSKSAKKSVRQDAVRRMRNRERKSALRTQIKMLDKIAAKNVIHKKTASRKKSRLAKMLNKQKAASS